MISLINLGANSIIDAAKVGTSLAMANLLINAPVAAIFNTTTAPNFLKCFTTLFALFCLGCFSASTHFLLFKELCHLYGAKNCPKNLSF